MNGRGGRGLDMTHKSTTSAVPPRPLAGCAPTGFANSGVAQVKNQLTLLIKTAATLPSYSIQRTAAVLKTTRKHD